MAEKTNKEPVNMTFGEALNQMKEFGRRVARKGWNGKGMFIELCDAEGTYTLYDGKTFGRRPYIYMKTADDMLVPWTASQTDVLAEDWEVVG